MSAVAKLPDDGGAECPGGPQSPVPDRVGGPRVLRLCSVFEVGAHLPPGAARFDPIGGMQHHTGSLTRLLDERGLSQTVVTCRLSRPAGEQRLGAAVRVRRHGWRLPVLRQLWALGALRDVLAATVTADVVHGHQGEDLAALPLALLAARRRRCPLVVTLHCSMAHTFRARAGRWALKALAAALERFVVRRADAVIVLTERARVAVAADGVPPERIRVLPSGVDEALFAGTRPDPFPCVGRPRVVYLGRLSPQKGVATLIDAFGRVPDPRAQLLLVGDGPDRARLERQATRSPAAGRIRFTGFVPHGGVPAVLASADVLVLPSVYEELGSVLVEALHVGTPVVASAVGGIPTLVEHGRTGVLVPPGDAEALAAAVRGLLTDPARARSLAEAGRRKVRRYGWRRVAAEVAEVYAGTLGVAGPGRSARS